MARKDAFGSAPPPPEMARGPDAEQPLLIRRGFHADTIKRLQEVIRWHPANRDTDQSQPMTMPNGTPCCIQRKRIEVGPTGPRYRYVILAGGHEPVKADTLDELLQVMSIEPMHKR